MRAKVKRAAEVGLASQPAAIFSVKSFTTFGVLKALQRVRVADPFGRIVCGFDDIPTSSPLYEPLAVLAQPAHQLGTRPAERLLRRVCIPDVSVRRSCVPRSWCATAQAPRHSLAQPRG